MGWKRGSEYKRYLKIGFAYLRGRVEGKGEDKVEYVIFGWMVVPIIGIPSK